MPMSRRRAADGSFGASQTLLHPDDDGGSGAGGSRRDSLASGGVSAALSLPRPSLQGQGSNAMSAADEVLERYTLHSTIECAPPPATAARRAHAAVRVAPLDSARACVQRCRGS